MGIIATGFKWYVADQLGINRSRVGFWCPCHNNPDLRDEEHDEHFFVDSPETADAAIPHSILTQARGEQALVHGLDSHIIPELRRQLSRVSV